jgi:Fe-S cluster assembly protein SufD
MKTLLDAFEQLAPRLAPAQRNQRRAALETLLGQGWPTRKQEAWRYTDLSPLSESRYAGATPGPAVDALSGTRALRFGPETAVSAPAGSAGPGLTRSLVGIFGQPGLDLHLEDTAATGEVLDASTSLGGGVHGWAHRVRVGTGARATLLLRQFGSGQTLDAQSLDVELEAGSQLTLVRVADAGSPATQLCQTRIVQGRDTQLRLVDLMIGGGRSRHELEIRLDAPGAQTTLHALAMPQGQGQTDLQLRLVHGAVQGNSRAYLRAVAGEQTRATLSGRIVVSEGACKTDSEQHMASLLLSPRAEVNAKPDLEIYNDDVKCAHGASFGQLDEDALYYLRARGLDADTARGLLTYAFAQHVLGQVPHAGLQQWLTRRLIGQLPVSLDALA